MDESYKGYSIEPLVSVPGRYKITTPAGLTFTNRGKGFEPRKVKKQIREHIKFMKG